MLLLRWYMAEMVKKFINFQFIEYVTHVNSYYNKVLNILYWPLQLSFMWNIKRYITEKIKRSLSLVTVILIMYLYFYYYLLFNYWSVSSHEYRKSRQQYYITNQDLEISVQRCRKQKNHTTSIFAKERCHAGSHLNQKSSTRHHVFSVKRYFKDE